ncbi:M23 family peptidase, partial [Aliarcobacter butzleri]|nr:M23 family peptidase [Aliarcobacter butzleri]
MSYINKKSSWLYILVAIMFVVVGVLAYALTLDRSAPKIIVQNEVMGKDIYWNLQNPIKIDIGDASGIKSYEVTFNDGQSQINLDTKVVKEDQNSVSLEISSPKNSEFLKATNGTLKIVAFDNSKWNFFKGNEAIKTTNVIIDRRSPIANVITNSYLLRQGGSGVLIVEVADDNLKDYYVTFNDEVIFELFPFYKKNYYISIITWPIDIKEFKRVNLVAIDMA